MIKLAIISLVIAAVLALLGFGGAAGTFVGIAKILFFIALAVFVVFLVLGILAGNASGLDLQRPNLGGSTHRDEYAVKTVC